MALHSPNVIDYISVHEASNTVVLHLVDADDWSSVTEHLLALQTKLEAYLNFIVEDQILEAYPLAIGRPVLICWITRFVVPEAAMTFLAQVQSLAATHNIGIEHLHLPEAN